MATQQQIAHNLNVAQITVSRALRGEKSVRGPLKTRIVAEAERLGYTFNEVARSFAQGKTGRFGIIIPDNGSFANRYFCGMLVGLSAAAKKCGVALVFLDMSQLRSAGELHRELASADGFVVRNSLNMQPRLSQLIEALRAKGKPYVLVQGNRSESGPAVAVDDREGAMRAVAYLHSLGHRCIAFHGGRGPGASMCERLDGFIEGLNRAGLPFREDLVAGQVEPDDGRFLDRLWARPAGERPTALFAWSDAVAVNDIHAATVRGIRVPQDLSVMGFSDFMVVPTLFRPHLTTLHIPAAEVGECAVRLVMHPPENPEEQVEILEPTLAIRESTAPPPADRGAR